MEKVKQILFSPKFEVGEEVYIIHKQKLTQSYVVSRAFVDDGECDIDITDKISMRWCSKPIINADQIRDSYITYTIGGDEKRVLRNEDGMWRTIQDYKDSL